MSVKIKLLKRIKNCELCSLCKGAYSPVPGDGNWNADIMIIGQNPGLTEAEEGIPFVGRSGMLLDIILDQAEIDRDTIWITNTVKCYTRNNRTPTDIEISSCKPYLKKEIRTVNPNVIIPMGAIACRGIGLGMPMHRMIGKIYRKFKAVVIPTWHPASTFYRPERKKDIFMDFDKSKRFLK